MDVTGNNIIFFKVCQLLSQMYKYWYPHDEGVLAEHKNTNV